MYVWRHIPILRFLLPFIIGIFCYVEFGWGVSPFIIFLALGLPTVLSFHFYFEQHINRPLQQVVSILALVLFCAIGYVLTWSYQQLHYPAHFAHSTSASELLVRIKNNPEQKAKSISCQVELISALDSTNQIEIAGEAQLYIETDSLSKQLQYGDYLLVANQLNKVTPPKNPHQFNFKKYYAQRNIYHQGYIRSGMWRATGQNKTMWLLEVAYKWQGYLKEKFAIYFEDEAVRGVAQAIVFGYKDDLDDEWMEAFSKTGTIHVLAVSGLHVGIIYILLSGLLLMKRSKGRALKIKSAIILLFLFAYCLLTGFAPSVSRASIMFGVVVVAKAYQRRSNIYNTLSFACFLLLAINPYNLYNVGFQFSFLAVVGIVYYKDSFRRRIPVSSYLGDKIVTLLSVSLAAQITTFPIGLYYFHQYPNLFMISNLIVIPCITVILYLGIGFIVVVSFSAVLAKFCASLMTLYIDFIARVVHYIQDIPYAFFEDVHITYWQMLSIYGFILAATIARKLESKVAAVAAISFVVLFLLADYRYEESLPKNEVVLFDVGRDFLAGFREGDKITFVASQGVYADQNKLDFVIRPYMVKERLDFNYTIIPDIMLSTTTDCVNFHSLGNGLVWFNNKSYHFLDYTEDYINGPVKSDVLIVGGNKSEKYLQKVLPVLGCTNIYLPRGKAKIMGLDKKVSHITPLYYEGFTLL